MKRTGDWIQTFTGRKFWPLDPRPDEVCIEDIAHALGQVARFGGHATRHYSVAQHCWHVSCRFDDPVLGLQGLLHDAAEAYLADVTRPVKPYLRVQPQLDFRATYSFAVLEDRIQKAICTRLNCPWPFPESIKRADERMLVTESMQLMGAPDWARAMIKRGTEPYTLGGDFLRLDVLSPAQASELFRVRYEQLQSAIRNPKS